MAIRDPHELIRARLDQLMAFLALGQHETETLDYKRDLSGDISRTVAAMANSKGGTIIVGVEEDSRTKTPKRYEGFVSARPLDQLNGHISTYLDPTPTLDSHLIQSGASVFLIVVVHPSTDYVVLHRNSGVLVRVGDASRAPQRSAFEALMLRHRATDGDQGDRVTVLKLLREELAPIPEQMTRRQGRSHPPSPYDVLSDMQWRTLSASGELRALKDLELRRAVSKAYELISQENVLEQQWRDVVGKRGYGADVPARNFAEQLKLLDRDTWRHACEACKAIDRALLAEGSEPGSNAETLTCP